MQTILDILEGLISSVPEALALYHKVAGLIAPKADVTDEQIAEVAALAPVVHAAVATTNQAVQALVATHTQPPADPSLDEDTAPDAPDAPAAA